MQTKLYLNELSLNNWAVNRRDVNSYVNGFMYTILRLVKCGAHKSLSHPRDFLTQELLNKFRLAQWLNDPAVDRDLITFAKSILTKAPYFESDEDLKRYELELKYNGQYGQGLLYAYMNDGIAISFLIAKEWDAPIISAEVSSLNEQGEIASSIYEIKHSSKDQHALEHCDYIQDSVINLLSDGDSLIRYSSHIFPGISFTEVSKKQIHELSNGDPHLKQIVRALVSLQDYLNSWDGEQFDIKQISCNISPESQETLQKYEEERTFRCSDGVDRLFSLHVKITPNEWRIYILPDHAQKEVIVGYIGKHLNTVKYKGN